MHVALIEQRVDLGAISSGGVTAICSAIAIICLTRQDQVVDKLALVMREVCEIARVPKDNHVRFVRLLEQCIQSAHDESRVRRGKSASAGAIKADFFEPVARAARTLRIALERMQGDHLAAGEAPRSAAAQLFFNCAMQRQFRFRDATHPIEALLQTLALDTVIEASDHASQASRAVAFQAGAQEGHRQTGLRHVCDETSGCRGDKRRQADDLQVGVSRRPVGWLVAAVHSTASAFPSPNQLPSCDGAWILA